MRQQAKPFTVEVKKSRKSASERPPLFGFLEEAVADVPTPPARLFERPAESRHNGHNGEHNGANGHADVEADIARVFGTAEAERPANRILPDLTAKPAVAEEDETPRPRRPRIAKSKAPRVPKPKPLPVTLVEPTVRQEAAPAPAPAARVRRRAKDEDGLQRADRWKRRLPRFAR
jgi:hypothetical protein